MDKKRKQEIDNLWMNTNVGKWAIALADGKKEEAEEILNKIFEINLSPYQYLMDEEKEVCKKLKKMFKDAEEGKEYILKLEEENGNLVDIMVAHEFSMLDFYQHGDIV